jgi:hypothetical protein
MPLYALIDGQPRRVLAGGPRRASCADCGKPMLARAGTVRIWHWAHLERNPHCEAALETEWHLAWKVLGIDGTQEVKVGRRRADILAPGGYAVEFQASTLDPAEVRTREDDWTAQGGMAWVFKADKPAAAGHIDAYGSFAGEEHLVKPENRATLDITWRWAPVQVRFARAPSFLDIGNDELLFIGRWRPGSSPLTGYGWKVSKDWVVQNLLRGSVIPAPLAGDPAEIKQKIEAWQRQREEANRKAALRLEALQREETTRAFERTPPLIDIDAAPGLRADPALVLREMEALLEDGSRGLPGSWTWELWPLRDDLRAVRTIWAAAVRASGGKLPTTAAVRRARQNYEQERPS